MSPSPVSSPPPPSTSLLSLPPFSSVSPARLTALYADFAPQKASNPPGFAANLVWWRSVLELASERAILPGSDSAGGALVLDVGDALVEGLRREGGGRAVGLGCVVSEMNSSGALLPLSTFLSAPTSIYAGPSLPSRIASTLIARPLWWGLQQLNIVGAEGSGTERESTDKRWNKVKGKYVVKATLEKAATNIIAHMQALPHSSLADVLFSPASFRAAFASHALAGATLPDSEIDVVLKFLERDRNVLRREGNVIKFDPSTSPPSSISSVDRGVLEMSTTLLALTSQISELESKIADRSSKAQEALRRGQKDIALSHLRSRKMFDELLLKRLGSLEVVQGVLVKVEMAAGDIEILKAYETSTSTLRTLLSTPSLQRDNVDATMDNMADALADHAEIEEVMRSGGEGARQAAEGGVAEDEGELERELEAMVKEQKEEKRRAEGERKVEEERQGKETVEDGEKEEMELKERLARLSGAPKGEVAEREGEKKKEKEKVLVEQ